jgi:hypothetical protein
MSASAVHAPRISPQTIAWPAQRHGLDRVDAEQVLAQVVAHEDRPRTAENAATKAHMRRGDSPQARGFVGLLDDHGSSRA